MCIREQGRFACGGLRKGGLSLIFGPSDQRIGVSHVNSSRHRTSQGPAHA